MARAALREADLLCESLEGAERVHVQVLNLLAHVQRAMSRPHLAITTLERARARADNPRTTATDRADLSSGLGLAYLGSKSTNPKTLEAAERAFQAARGEYPRHCSWYDLARIDQNLALIDVRRADGASGSGDEDQGHLLRAMDLLIPSLLAKFAVRFTLTTRELRKAWNDQQVLGLNVAIGVAMRLRGGGRLLADLVLLTRVQGTFVPVSGPRREDMAAQELERPGEFADVASGEGVPVAVAELFGVDEPALLVPPPSLMAPDGRTVLDAYFERAFERYAKSGLPADRLRRPGRVRL